jgi:hypothetical protein
MPQYVLNCKPFGVVYVSEEQLEDESRGFNDAV